VQIRFLVEPLLPALVVTVLYRHRHRRLLALGLHHLEECLRQMAKGSLEAAEESTLEAVEALEGWPSVEDEVPHEDMVLGINHLQRLVS